MLAKWDGWRTIIGHGCRKWAWRREECSWSRTGGTWRSLADIISESWRSLEDIIIKLVGHWWTLSQKLWSHWRTLSQEDGGHWQTLSPNLYVTGGHYLTHLEVTDRHYLRKMEVTGGHYSESWRVLTDITQKLVGHWRILSEKDGGHWWRLLWNVNVTGRLYFRNLETTELCQKQYWIEGIFE